MLIKKKIQDTNEHNSDNCSDVISLSNLPLVSVLIPLYNHEKFIVDCLNSIIDQNYPNIEIILIDDASKDDGLQIAMDRLTSVRIDHTVLKNSYNKGICATLNKALSVANGNYVCFIASDDLLANDRIRNHINILEKSNDDFIIACHGPVKIFGDDLKISALKGSDDERDYSLPSVLMKTVKINLQGCTFYRNALKKFPFDESLYFEDWDFFIRVFLQNYKIIHDENISAFYRKHPDGASKNFTQMIEARKKIRDKYFEIIALRDTKLAYSFDFTIRFWNLVTMSYQGNKLIWIANLFKLFSKNPIKSIFKIRDIFWSFKNLFF